MSYTIEFTMQGAVSTSKRHCEVRGDALDAWDEAVEYALGGDKLRLIDNSTGSVLSTYSPVDRGET